MGSHLFTQNGLKFNKRPSNGAQLKETIMDHEKAIEYLEEMKNFYVKFKTSERHLLDDIELYIDKTIDSIEELLEFEE